MRYWLLRIEAIVPDASIKVYSNSQILKSLLGFQSLCLSSCIHNKWQSQSLCCGESRFSFLKCWQNNTRWTHMGGIVLDHCSMLELMLSLLEAALPLNCCNPLYITFLSTLQFCLKLPARDGVNVFFLKFGTINIQNALGIIKKVVLMVTNLFQQYVIMRQSYWFQ